MTWITRTALIIGTLIVPIFLYTTTFEDVLYSETNPAKSFAGLLNIFWIVVGFPIALITALIVRFLTKKKPKADLYFVLGLLVPSLLVWIVLILSVKLD